MMRPNFRRNALLAFLLTLGCGVGLWRFLSHRDALGWLRRLQHQPARLSKFFPGNDAKPQVRFVPCSIMEEFRGTSTVKKVALRDGPGEGAAIVAEIEMKYPVSILGATRDFVHVQYPDSRLLRSSGEQRDEHSPKAEGWAAWGEIFAEHSAAVLDTESGSVVARLLVPYNDYKVAFAPDAQRVIFYGDGDAREVRMADYESARCLRAADSYSIGSIFYQPDGALYAAVFAPDEPGKFRDRQMNVVRVSDTGEPSQLTELSAVASDFQLSEDGRTGFILHRTDDWRNQVNQVKVVDLQTLKIRNSFKMEREEFFPSFLINRSGSEWYIKPYRSPSVLVIDTRTGQLAREFPDETEQDLLPPDTKVVGDALYFMDYSTTPQRMVALSSAGTTVANPLLARAVAVDGALFSINVEGTSLLKLSADGQIQDSFSLERPELRLNPKATGSGFVRRLAAIPNSKRLLLFNGYVEEAQMMECSPTTKPAGGVKH